MFTPIHHHDQHLLILPLDRSPVKVCVSLDGGEILVLDSPFMRIDMRKSRMTKHVKSTLTHSCEYLYVRELLEHGLPIRLLELE